MKSILGNGNKIYRMAMVNISGMKTRLNSKLLRMLTKDFGNKENVLALAHFITPTATNLKVSFLKT